MNEHVPIDPLRFNQPEPQPGNPYYGSAPHLPAVPQREVTVVQPPAPTSPVIVINPGGAQENTQAVPQAQPFQQGRYIPGLLYPGGVPGGSRENRHIVRRSLILAGKAALALTAVSVLLNTARSADFRGAEKEVVTSHDRQSLKDLRHTWSLTGAPQNHGFKPAAWDNYKPVTAFHVTGNVLPQWTMTGLSDGQKHPLNPSPFESQIDMTGTVGVKVLDNSAVQAHYDHRKKREIVNIDESKLGLAVNVSGWDAQLKEFNVHAPSILPGLTAADKQKIATTIHSTNVNVLVPKLLPELAVSALDSKQSENSAGVAGACQSFIAKQALKIVEAGVIAQAKGHNPPIFLTTGNFAKPTGGFNVNKAFYGSRGWESLQQLLDRNPQYSLLSPDPKKPNDTKLEDVIGALSCNTGASSSST